MGQSEYVTRSGRVVRVGKRYTDTKRVEPRTLRVESIDDPRPDYKGVERCRVHLAVLDQAGNVVRLVPMEADRLVSAAFKPLDPR